MKSEAELSDKEWRQMRRQMSKLDFDPVPETPALLPRSLYGESDKELAAICEEHEKPEEALESAVVAADACSNHNDSPTSRSCSGISPGRESIVLSAPIRSAIPASYPDDINQKQSEKEAIKARVLDAQLAMAQEATRRSIMSAFMELRAKKTKDEALERSKLSAAHMTDVATLKNKVKELKLRVAQAEAKREQQELLLDRFSELTAKQSHRNEYAFAGGAQQLNKR
ncbi:hypothetical protein PHYSODRAFT_253137 [Phytophthora sojae]|uniref:Uncharacterized protein n=1 Tax=Phytophthora sojae (strain P6497) TaxID=1094619 RepID=G4YSQ8_PHYSP|nr:hypothetical protein PHYSODRAFT_253137 [Phytophthora sojae]EGZ24180.1 hypothetical protein PHYSODRAFT_253137 [Phytophthora sojae]|eukprot:XP_009519468.1 hypothetical protein PHYSODRAFT_253137 [Phytophthora sojae]